MDYMEQNEDTLRMVRIDGRLSVVVGNGELPTTLVWELEEGDWAVEAPPDVM